MSTEPNSICMKKGCANFREVVFTFTGVVFMLLYLSAPVAAQKWVSVKTTNFFLIGDADEIELRQAALRLEQFREAFRLLFPEIKLDGGIRTNVVVFRNAAAFRPFKPKRPDGSIDESVAGYFLPGEDVNYITLSADEKNSAYGTIYHEYVHFLLNINVGRSDLPPWLNEGLAEYYETLQVIGDRQISLGTPPNGHLRLLRRSEPIHFKDFFAIDNAALHHNGDESRSLFYAQAWAMVHYLIHSEKTGGTNKLDKFLTFFKSKEPSEKAFEQSFQSSYENLERELRRYIEKPAPSTVISLPGKLNLSQVEQATSLTDAETSAYLGDLLYHNNNLAEAEVFLRKAIAIDEHSSLGNASLGLVLTRQKKYSDARKYLERAIAVDKTNYLAHFNYAYAVQIENSDEFGHISVFSPDALLRMRTALKQAISINPGFAESYRLLAFVNFVNDENLDEAIELLRKGLAIQPGNQEFSILLARILLRLEKYDESKAIADKIIKTAADARVWSEADGILRTVNQYKAVTNAGKQDSEVFKLFGPMPPLILKRSSLSDADVAKFDEERMITNLNHLLAKPRFGEKQVVGTLERVACSDEEINYSVQSAGDKFYLASRDFTNLKLNVLTEGEKSFRLDCGVNFGKQLVVFTFRPSATSKPKIRGQLLSLTFVPDYFRLKTAEEMANFRTVIIEDDRVFKSNAGKATSADPQKKNP